MAASGSSGRAVVLGRLHGMARRWTVRWVLGNVKAPPRIGVDIFGLLVSGADGISLSFVLPKVKFSNM